MSHHVPHTVSEYHILFNLCIISTERHDKITSLTPCPSHSIILLPFVCISFWAYTIHFIFLQEYYTYMYLPFVHHIYWVMSLPYRHIHVLTICTSFLLSNELTLSPYTCTYHLCIVHIEYWAYPIPIYMYLPCAHHYWVLSLPHPHIHVLTICTSYLPSTELTPSPYTCTHRIY